MLMMGLKQWVLWTTWFIKQFIFLSISAIFVALLLKVMAKLYLRHSFVHATKNVYEHKMLECVTGILQVGGVFPASDFFLLLAFLIVFNISAISFCFFLR